MFVLGITGGIGCGKTTVANILRAHGLEVLDADKISHEVSQKGGSAIDAIIDEFGPEYINEDGSLNRKMMADLVFNNSRALDKLSLIIHEKVFAEMRKIRNKRKQAGAKAIAMDVPVPAKQGFLDVSDQVWVVWSDLEIRLERLEKRGMPKAEALDRISVQLSKDEYLSLADNVILNNSDIKALETKVNELIKSEFHARGIRLSLGYPYLESLENA